MDDMSRVVGFKGSMYIHHSAVCIPQHIFYKSKTQAESHHWTIRKCHEISVLSYNKFTVSIIV